MDCAIWPGFAVSSAFRAATSASRIADLLGFTGFVSRASVARIAVGSGVIVGASLGLRLPFRFSLARFTGFSFCALGAVGMGCRRGRAGEL